MGELVAGQFAEQDGTGVIKPRRRRGVAENRIGAMPTLTARWRRMLMERVATTPCLEVWKEQGLLSGHLGCRGFYHTRCSIVVGGT